MTDRNRDFEIAVLGGTLDNWEEVKKSGSEHYKGGVEPIDLYKSGGMLKDFALCNIIKYAYRQRGGPNHKDLDKIIHYARMLKATIPVQE